MGENKTNPGVLFGVLGLLVVILAVAVYMLIDTRKNLNVVLPTWQKKQSFSEWSGIPWSGN